MRQIAIHTSGSVCQAYVGAGARAALPASIAHLNGVRKIAVIVDAHVAELHLRKLASVLPMAHVVCSFPSGEGSKTLGHAEFLYDQLAAARVERNDLVVTFGGGVAGDLGGFVAATWMRGIRYVQVPTTTEAAIDASVGGKTAVNHRAGKNLIGAFHQPSAVIVDTDFFATLPQRDFVAGLAESVKHAAIRDADFLAWHEANAAFIVQRDSATIIDLIVRNIAIKAAVVQADEREAHLRQILNYGHTLGHAIEHLLDYEPRHGECVGLGIIAENEIAVGRGLLCRPVAQRIAALLSAIGLPTHLPRGLNPRDVIAITQADKKVTAGAVTYVLISDLGQPVWVNDVREEEIAAAFTAIAPGL